MSLTIFQRDRSGSWARFGLFLTRKVEPSSRCGPDVTYASAVKGNEDEATVRDVSEAKSAARRRQLAKPSRRKAFSARGQGIVTVAVFHAYSSRATLLYRGLHLSLIQHTVDHASSIPDDRARIKTVDRFFAFQAKSDLNNSEFISQSVSSEKRLEQRR